EFRRVLFRSERQLPGGVRELAQAQQQGGAFFVQRAIAALGLACDALEIPDVPLPRGNLTLDERDDHLRFGFGLGLRLRLGRRRRWRWRWWHGGQDNRFRLWLGLRFW